MKATFEFLKEVRVNNSREWFAEHKELWLRAKAEAEGLAQRFIDAVAVQDPRAARFSPADCMYRIYRDTRFSPDKTPYKTHIGIFVNPPKGKKSQTLGYYIHLEPGNTFVGGGTIDLPSKLLNAVRREIYENIDEYIGIVEDPEFKKYFPTVGDNLLKTAPKGFPKDWEYIQYLRPRDFVISMKVKDDFFDRPDAMKKLAPVLAQAARFIRFINFAITEAEADMATSQPVRW